MRALSTVVLASVLVAHCKQKEVAQTPPVPSAAPDVSAPSAVTVPASSAWSGALGTDEVRVWIGAQPFGAGGGAIDAVLFDVTTEVFTRLAGTVDARGRVRAAEPTKSGAQLDATFDDGTLVGTWSEPRRAPLELRLVTLKGTPEPSTSRAFVGTLGATRVRAKLDLGASVSGVYRYPRSREDLHLSGPLDEATGRFDLVETAGGAKTGEWSGYFLTPTFAAGSWRSPDGAKRLVFTISSGIAAGDTAYPDIADLGGGIKLVPQEDFKEIAPHCTSSRVWPEVADGALARKVNPALRSLAPEHELTPDACRAATADLPYFNEASYTVTGKRGSVVGLRVDRTSFTGGAHEARSFVCRALDLDKGRLVDVAKEMTPSARESLSKLATATLQREHGQTDLTKAGFFEPSVRVTESTAVCVTDAGALVAFNPYEVAPWSMGAPTVKLPFADVRLLLPSDLASSM